MTENISPRPAPAPFRYSGTEQDAMGEARNYYRWILAQFLPYLGEEMVEVGAGVGNFAAHVLAARPEIRLTLIEPAENLAPGLAARFSGNPNVIVRNGNLETYAAGLSADSAAMVNVLEHVEDDSSCLLQLRGILRPGGRVLLLVPAVPAICGSLDAAFDHYRRYSRRELLGKLAAAGLEIEKLRYVNLPGVAAWWMAGNLLRCRTLSAGSVRFYDRWVVPWLCKIEGVWAPPIGQSLLAVARR
jgi:SAM-dependent methyltransferase